MTSQYNIVISATARFGSTDEKMALLTDIATLANKYGAIKDIWIDTEISQIYLKMICRSKNYDTIRQFRGAWSQLETASKWADISIEEYEIPIEEPAESETREITTVYEDQSTTIIKGYDDVGNPIEETISIKVPVESYYLDEQGNKVYLVRRVS
jgi:hypothetical protein